MSIYFMSIYLHLRSPRNNLSSISLIYFFNIISLYFMKYINNYTINYLFLYKKAIIVFSVLIYNKNFCIILITLFELIPIYHMLFIIFAYDELQVYSINNHT